MTVTEWEKHTLLADVAMQKSDHLRSILHYQQALTISEQLTHEEEIQIEDRLIVSVISCHNMASFWRSVGDERYELKYLQLASEKVLSLIPQCANSQCDSYIDSLGCCKKALIEFLKRHPNPYIAKQVSHLDSATNCNLISMFQLN
ncbi:DUF2753 family protein [Vibrio genomosp. F10]|uniref:DUF2753 domain-containing protein n=1 Tax=Vibrio genomosp. F10 TaxID=723171 RepID=A0A1B9R1A2_9VIBR|nr:DUF2753 family protein [Vibrio genomosp. F10]OCH77710.1 hypothetical protein A6E14_01080 [Vibrio genomosp. F10]